MLEYLNVYTHYQVLILTGNPDNPSVTIDLYLCPKSYVRLTTESFVKFAAAWIEVHGKDFSSVTYLTNSFIYSCGLYGTNVITETSLIDCDIAGLTVDNSRACFREGGGPTRYQRMSFNAASVFRAVLPADGLIVSSLLEDFALTTLDTDQTPKDDEEDPLPHRYMFNQCQIVNVDIFNHQSNDLTLFSCMITDSTLEIVGEVAYFEQQNMAGIELRGNNFYLTGKLSFCPLALPRVDIYLFRAGIKDWAVTGSYADGSFIITHTSDPNWEDHLKRIIGRMDVVEQESYFNYLRDAIHSRINLVDGLEQSKLARDKHG